MEKPIIIIREELRDFRNRVEDAMKKFKLNTGLNIIDIDFSVHYRHTLVKNNSIDYVCIDKIKLEPLKEGGD